MNRIEEGGRQAFSCFFHPVRSSYSEAEPKRRLLGWLRASSSAAGRSSFIIAAVVSAFAWQTAVASCLEYGAVTLRGTVVRQTYPGPPDFESVTKGDEPRVIWILLLEPGVCVVDPEGRQPRVRYEREIQLLGRSGPYTRFTALLGKRIVVHGELQHGGARYDKRLVIEVEEIATSGRGETPSQDPYDRR